MEALKLFVFLGLLAIIGGQTCYQCKYGRDCNDPFRSAASIKCDKSCFKAKKVENGRLTVSRGCGNYTGGAGPCTAGYLTGKNFTLNLYCCDGLNCNGTGRFLGDAGLVLVFAVISRLIFAR